MATGNNRESWVNLQQEVKGERQSAGAAAAAAAAAAAGVMGANIKSGNVVAVRCEEALLTVLCRRGVGGR